MDFQHRSQRPDLRLDGFTGSGFYQILKPSLRRIQTHRVIEHIVTNLIRVHRVHVSKVNFSLLNVCSTFSHYSHGFLESPPEKGWPPFNYLMFTFSLTHDDYNQSYEVNQKWQLNNVSAWGTEIFEYITVGVSAIQAHEMGLTQLGAPEVEYLYNIVGVVTKNMLWHKNMGLFSGSSWDSFYNDSLDMYSSTYKYKGIHSLLRDVPYPYWVFSEYLWEKAPNILHPKMINSKTTEWFFRNVNTVWNRVNRNDGARSAIFGVGTQARSGLTKEVFQSLLKMVQELNSKRPLSDLLAPSILAGMVFEGENRILDELYNSSDLAELFGADDVDLGSIFSQPTSIAERIVTGDTQLANSLAGEVNIF